MSAILSPVGLSVPLLIGLQLLSRGKVRDVYLLPRGQLLIVTTDRISIFDFVLNALVPMKGAVLNAITVFWLHMLEELGIPTHLIAWGQDIDRYLPKELRGNLDLQMRAMVVEPLKMDADVEFITRGNLTGTGYQDYLKTGMVCGHRLPAGLEDGDELPFTLFTPSTKAKVGHDVNIDARRIIQRYPEESMLSVQIYEMGRAFARKCGFILADTKFEFGRNWRGKLKVGDEVLTFDSSRYWLMVEWLRMQHLTTRKAPSGYDKQRGRQAGILAGINKLDPKIPEHIARAHAWSMPADVIAGLTQAYRYSYWVLTGKVVEAVFEAPRPKKKVTLLVGSESDLTPALQEMIDVWGHSRAFAELRVHVMSCHRNRRKLDAYLTNGCDGADVIVGMGSKALALPGVIDSWNYEPGFDTPVVGVITGRPGSQPFEAARLSILELPGEPVIFDERNGAVYANEEGLDAALGRIAHGELPPPKARETKPIKRDVMGPYITNDID